MLNSCKFGCVAFGALVAACGTASAQIWAEVGDAPVRPAFQATIGAGPLTTILGHGNTDATGSIDVDMYCVHIDGQWSASTLGGAGWDTMLALYAIDGVTLLAANDDAGGTLQSFISGSNAPGDYLLGITRFPDFGWDDLGGQGSDPYRIELTGMSYCQVPAPGAMALLGLGGLAVARRRR